LLFGLGILALLAGAMLVVLWFHAPSPSAAPVAQVIPSASILVATHSLPAGALLRAPDMAWTDVPASQVAETSIVRGTRTEAEFVGAVTRNHFDTWSPLLTNDLVKPGDRDFLITALKPGYRAMTIYVDAAQSESGLLLPDDRVDVILTQTFSTPSAEAGRKSVSETVLRDLRVIAVDQTLIEAEKPASPPAAIGDVKLPKTVTLEVTEHQAAMLLVAEQLGKIQLTLLGQQDMDAASSDKGAEPPPTWASDVSPALAAPESGPPASVRGGPIDVIHGAKTERLCETTAGLHTCP
jgi:pilus assembly protein CpaB